MSSTKTGRAVRGRAGGKTAVLFSLCMAPFHITRSPANDKLNHSGRISARARIKPGRESVIGKHRIGENSGSEIHAGPANNFW